MKKGDSVYMKTKVYHYDQYGKAYNFEKHDEFLIIDIWGNVHQTYVEISHKRDKHNIILFLSSLKRTSLTRNELRALKLKEINEKGRYSHL